MITNEKQLPVINPLPWHSHKYEDVLRSFRTSRQGLSKEEIRQRQQIYGPNELKKDKRFLSFRILARQVRSPLVLILIIAGLITILLQDYVNSAIIWFVVVINTAFGFFQEKKSSDALAKLQTYIKDKAIVKRNGNYFEILSSEIVPGDILVLRSEIKVAADARIIESQGLRVNEAALTGESLSQEKNTEILPEKTVLADRANMAFMGTVIEEGESLAVVTAIGDDTELGRIAGLVSAIKERSTPLQKKLKHLSKIVSVAVFIGALVVFLSGLAFEKDIPQIFITAVAVAVAAVPESLPVAVTVILAVGMQRILKRHGLVRKLIAAETLGSVSVIATDKTGTLTKGKMEIAVIAAGKELFERDLIGSFHIKKDIFENHIKVLEGAVYCSEAIIENPESMFENWILRGQPTEQALILGGLQAGLNKITMEKENPVIDRIFFNPARKYKAALVNVSAKNGASSKNDFFICGAPEKILLFSSYYWDLGKREKLMPQNIKAIKDKFENMMSQGLRVLAVGYRDVDWQEIPDNIRNAKNHSSLSGITFLGLIGLKDPLRKEVKNALDKAVSAGLKPIIVTGDHRLTVQAIAEELGMRVKDENIIEGESLDGISDEELKEKILKIKIFARVSPQHKLRIIEAWKSNGYSIAMTGDGVNDAPALKRADIGIAVGSGTDIAKEIADIVLLDDNFGTLVAAIEEGRTIFDNIRKVITFVLSDSFTEIILVSGSIFLGLPLPVTAAQILWSNFVEDSGPVMALSFEPAEKDAMAVPPRDTREPLLNGEMKFIIFVIGIITDLILFALFLYFIRSGYNEIYARTIIFSALGTNSLFYVFSIRSLRQPIWRINFWSNKLLLLAVALGLFFVVIAVYLPFLQVILGTTAIGLKEWAIIFSLGLVNIMGIEIAKKIYKV